eukprot:TRINITY_DN2003_c0_g1_i2.p1 TRINITY_DN2003_c0_g1~~TRINITY_DN2003_c0_g1_i2.p1  ORF type:complete len:301 (+),score=64.19 TRINITY_DN2003_c0_g1_i2:207-1109(+)
MIICLIVSDGNEAVCEDGVFLLDRDMYYTVVTEEDIDGADDREEPSFEEKMNHIFMVEQRRKAFLSDHWVKRHPWLYSLNDGFFTEEFLNAMNEYKASEDPQSINSFVNELSDTRLYSGYVFSQKFCDDFMEEVFGIVESGLPLLRPNSMNNYGVVLADVGMDSIWLELLTYLKPMFSVLFPECYEKLDEHHTFTVHYKMDRQKELDMHVDSSLVTINLCLGKQFKGGDLYFRGHAGSQEEENLFVEHSRGTALFHLGSHIHGATPITEGERMNLIIWYRSTEDTSQQILSDKHDNHPTV